MCLEALVAHGDSCPSCCLEIGARVGIDEVSVALGELTPKLPLTLDSASKLDPIHDCCAALVRLTRLVEALCINFALDQAVAGEKTPIVPTSSPGPREVIDIVNAGRRLNHEDALALLYKATIMLADAPNVATIRAPLAIVGDVHGAIDDVLRMLAEHGFPGDEIRDAKGRLIGVVRVLMMGDYVDRGDFSCEVLLVLASLAIAFPNEFVMLRGNHEAQEVSERYGYKGDCHQDYSAIFYSYSVEFFKALQLAAKIKCTKDTLFAVHGGISPLLKTVTEINALDRRVEPEPRYRYDEAEVDLLTMNQVGRI